ncbi:MAG TPA: ATP-binding cassette domain-containing protein [Casimicrobiaceae bacterium]|nr:ATP-binding cassette domain-containing protein [Casimicrobiaceae bacterium]
MFALTGIEHRFGTTLALRVPAWSAAPSERWLIAGPSGSGKSTLLHLLAGLLRPSLGRVVIGGQNIGELSDSALDRWRGRHVGFVPQRLHLLASLSVLDNLLLAQYLAGARSDSATAQAMLATLGVGDLALRMPETLSQGQAQRVAIARAAVNRPALLLADEPTAALDDANALSAVGLLAAQADAVGATLVVASHDGRIRDAFARRYDLEVAT